MCLQRVALGGPEWRLELKQLSEGLREQYDISFLECSVGNALERMALTKPANPKILEF